MSEIRNLLSSAQDAEARGRKEEAGRLLREAAAFYRDRQMLRRAAQMLRQARRVEGIVETDEEDVFGFDVPAVEMADAGLPLDAAADRLDSAPDEHTGSPDVDRLDEQDALGELGGGRVLVEQRSPQLAAPSMAAWCSFCCSPGEQVGPLVAGPAGAFVCASCVAVSSGLLGAGPAPAWEVRALGFELPAQRRARLRFERARARLALVIGPEGTGKTAWLRSLGSHPGVRQLEIDGPFSRDAEDELLRWVDDANRTAFLVVRAPVPPPALVLQGEHGEEPLHDTATLVGAVPHLSARVLARVDAVMSFEPPGAADLDQLARALASSRGVALPDAVLGQLVAIAERSARGAHELATLIARLAPGTYRP